MQVLKSVGRKLESFLSELSPRALALIIRGLEGQDNTPRDAFILKTARRMVAEAEGQKSGAPIGAGIENQTGSGIDIAALKSIFFADIGHYLVDDPVPHKLEGVISSASVDPIWNWFARDVAPDKIADLVAAGAAGELGPKPQESERLQTTRGALLEIVREHLADIRTSAIAHQRLASHIGGERVLVDLVDVVGIFADSQILPVFLDTLPTQVVAEDCEAGTPFIVALESFADANPDLICWAASAIYNRADSPLIMPSLATRLAGSDRAMDVEASIFAPFAAIFLFHIHRRIQLLNESIATATNDSRTVEIIADLHELIRGLLVDIEFDGASDWRDELSAIRRQLSEVIGGQIEPLVGTLQRSLRVTRLPDENGLYIDRHAMEDAEHGLRLFMAARDASESIALNELLGKSAKSIEQTLEILTANAFDKLKSAGSADRKSLLPIAECAVGLSAIYFGDDYAAHLRRSLANLVGTLPSNRIRQAG